MKHEIKIRDLGWEKLHELHLEGWNAPIATLAVDARGAFREPKTPTINWSAIGRQDAATTRAFAEGLLELAAVAASLQETK